jgi:hypothetical protein
MGPLAAVENNSEDSLEIKRHASIRPIGSSAVALYLNPGFGPYIYQQFCGI